MIKGYIRCAFCNLVKIPPHEGGRKRGGQHICEACEKEYKNIFGGNRLTLINNLSKLAAVV
jgi:hypothetical protein